ncbi:alpha/beta fold hydrolase [Nonlabens mediterrranea]|uniref:Alpha/beta fold hydrolase n=1 Tax=Nonlabens mediterrranea TaxID=1419947 RepID=A0ABS0A8J0_9FLAO|nr:alpha/beta fold hydrolase [Nonlabens mediterrranea]
MSASLYHIELPGFKLSYGKVQTVHVSYQIFGRQLHTAPIVLVNHALTGNSSVIDWWSEIVGSGKAVDTNRYTVIVIDIPGNGFDENVEHLIYNYQDWQLSDVARVFQLVLSELRICYVHVGIGGSIGGCLLWEMVVAYPELFGTIIPIAADWKATDWIIANCHIQERLLKHSSNPLEDARQHAMTLYRTPQSLRYKFNRELDTEFKVKQWLNHHGVALKKRFTLPAYKLVNHLLATVNAARKYEENILKALSNSNVKIRVVAINSDGFFTAQEDRETVKLLSRYINITYQEIDSIHGHDAFLIEHYQVRELLENYLAEVESKAPLKECV